MKSPLIAVLVAVWSWSAIAADAPDAEMQLNEVRVLVARGTLDEARIALEKLTGDESQPTVVRAQAWNILATIHVRQGRLRDANYALTRALVLDQSFDLAWENLGDVNLGLALQAYAQAARTRPSPRLDEAKIHLRKLLATTAGTPPQQSASETAESPPESAVRTALEQWRTAWQRRDAEGYLAAYAADFQPTGAVNVGAWRNQRTKRLAAAKTVMVTIKDLTLTTLPAPGRIAASFSEQLRADDYYRTQRKTLEWRHDDNGWHIVREISNP